MDYLLKKWTAWYHTLDVNHDGCLSYGDVEECQTKFLDVNGITGDKATQIKDEVEKWWTTYVLPSKDASVTLEQFLGKQKEEYSADAEGFTKRMTDCFSAIFDVFDANKDREMSVDELVNAFKSFGHDNEKLVRQNFTLMEPKNDTVPLKDVVNAWVQFTTGNDPAQKDVIRDSIEGF